MMPKEQDRDILVLFFFVFGALKTVTNKMLAEDPGKGFNLDEIVLNYEIINRMPH